MIFHLLNTFFILFFLKQSIFISAFANYKNKNILDKEKYALLTGENPEEIQKIIWNEKFSTHQYIYGKAPAKMLSDNIEFFPQGGRILDVGMGEGRNAVYLARNRFNVTGIDISSVAIKKARKLAKEFNVHFDMIESNIKDYPFKENTFDGIICLYFFDRNLSHYFLKLLKPGGILLLGTYTQKQLDVKGFNKDQYKLEHFLKPQELLSLFPKVTILKFEEPIHNPLNFESYIIIQKPY